MLKPVFIYNANFERCLDTCTTNNFIFYYDKDTTALLNLILSSLSLYCHFGSSEFLGGLVACGT